MQTTTTYKQETITRWQFAFLGGDAYSIEQKMDRGDVVEVNDKAIEITFLTDDGEAIREVVTVERRNLLYYGKAVITRDIRDKSDTPLGQEVQRRGLNKRT